MREHKIFMKNVSLLLILLMMLGLFTFAPWTAPTAAAADTDNNNVSSVSDSTLNTLGFNTDSSDIQDIIDDGSQPLGVGNLGVSLCETNDLFFARTEYDTSYSKDWQHHTTLSWDFNTDSIGGVDNDAMRSVAFDPTGSGFLDYVAAVYAKYNMSGSTVTSTALTLGIFNRSGQVASIPLCTLPFDVRPVQAGAFLSLTAGDFNGDGRDELAVYNPYQSIPVDTACPPQIEFYHWDPQTGTPLEKAASSLPISSGVLRGSTWQYTSFVFNGKGDAIEKDDFPAIDLTAVKQPGRAAADLIVAVSPSRSYYNKDAVSLGGNFACTFASRVAICEQPLTAQRSISVYSMAWQGPSYGLNTTDNGEKAYDYEVMMFAGVDAGNMQGSGYQSVVIAGYEQDTSTNYLSTAKLSHPKDSANYLITYMNYDPSLNGGKGGYVQPQLGQRLSTGDSTLKNSIKIKIYDDTNTDNLVLEPLDVTSFAERGFGFADSVFVNGLVVCLQDQTDSSVTGSTLQDMVFDCKGNPNVISKIPNPFVVRYAVPTDTFKWVADNNAANNLFTESAAGNFDNNQNGQEQLVYAYLVKKGSSAIWGTAGGKLIPQKTGDFPVGMTDSDEISNVTNDYRYITTSKKFASLSIAASDFLHRSTVMRYDNTKSPDFYFSDPNVIAVLQAPPYFSELNYDYYGSTALTVTEGSGTTETHSVNLTLGAYVGFKTESKTIGLAYEAEVKLTASVSAGYEYEMAKSINYSITYATGEEDAVALTMTPYIRYYYQIWDPGDDNVAGAWIDATFNVPQTPQVTQLPVEQYDMVASQQGWDTIGGNILKSTPGDPATYAVPFNTKDADGEETWSAGKAAGVSPDIDGYIRVGMGTGRITQTIDQSTQRTDSVTWGATLGLEADVAFGVGFLGTGAMATAGYSIETEYTGSYGWADLKGSTYAGEVSDIPSAYGADYSFNWLFGSWTGTLDGRNCIVLGYKVKNVVGLPKPPTDLHVDDVTSNSATLSWSASENAVYTVLYRYYQGVYYPLTTLDGADRDLNGMYRYTDTSVRPGGVYQYVAAVIGYAGLVNMLRLSPYCSPVTAYTPPDTGVPAITQQPEDVSVFVGQTAKFSAAATGAPGAGNGPISYQWQSYNVRTGWTYILDAIYQSATLTLSSVTQGMDGNKYRCTVTQMVNGNPVTIYSKTVSLNVGKGDTVTDVAVSQDKGAASYTEQVTATETQSIQHYLTATYAGQTYDVLQGGTDYYLTQDGKQYYTIAADDLTAVKNAAEAASATGDPAPAVALSAAPTSISYSAPLLYADSGIDTGLRTDILEEAPISGVTPKSFSREFLIYDCFLYTLEGNSVYAVMLDEERYFRDGYFDELYIADGEQFFRQASSGQVTTIPITILDEPGTRLESPVLVDGHMTTDQYDVYSDELNTVYSAIMYTETIYWLDDTDQYSEVVIGDYVSDVAGFNPDTLEQIENGTEEILAGTLTTRRVAGEPVTLAAAVTEKTSSETTPTGTVTFMITNTDTGYSQAINARLDAGGKATAIWTPDAPGNYSVTAKYNGDDNKDRFNTSVSVPESYYAYVNGSYLALEGDASMTYGDPPVTLSPKLYTTTDGVTAPPVTVSGVTYTVTLSSIDVTSAVMSGNTFTPNSGGAYMVSAQYTDEANQLYTASKSIIVAKAPLTVTPLPQEWGKNQLDPSILDVVIGSASPATLSVNGLVSGDSAEGMFALSLLDTSTPVADLNPGSYTILAGWAPGIAQSALTDKYTVAFGTDDLKVTAMSYNVKFASGSNGSVNARNADNIPFSSGNSVPADTNMTFSAVPDNGYTVDTWTVNGIPTDYTTLSVSMPLTEAMEVYVTFKPQTYSLTFDADPNGSVTARYGTASVPGNAIYSPTTIAALAPVYLTATPNDGHVIKEWLVNGVVVTNPDNSLYVGSTYQIDKMTEDTDVAVHFEAIKYFSVTVTALDGSGDPIAANLGSVSVSPELDGSGRVMVGSQLTITTTCDPAYQIKEWRVYSDTGTLTDARGKYNILQGNVAGYTVYNLQSDLDIAVIFVTQFKYTLSFSAGPNGSIAAEGAAGPLTSGLQYYSYIPITFTAVPDVGFGVDRWEVDGTPVPGQTGETLQTGLDHDNLSVRVFFREKPVITYTASSGGTVTASGGTDVIPSGGRVDLGSDVTFTITPTTGYEVTALALDGSANILPDAQYVSGTDTMTYTIADVQADHTLTAVFSAIPSVAVNYSVFDNGTGYHGTLSAGVERKGMDTYKQTGTSGTSGTLTGVYRDSVVTFTAVPASGNYVVDKWTVNGVVQDSTLNTLSVTVDATAPNPLNVVVQFRSKWVWQNPFIDVHENDWFYGDVEFVHVNGLMIGTAADLFSPNAAITRGMVVTVLYRLAGSPYVAGLDNPFGDVATGQYYSGAVIWAAKNGIVFGYGDDSFGPDDFVTREQLAAILYRYAAWAKIALPASGDLTFNDKDSVSGYAKAPVSSLVKAGVINGKPSNLFDPKGNATRAEFAAMLHRFIDATEKQ